nr:hypothetical protein [Tanacetum cinerariifolium]
MELSHSMQLIDCLPQAVHISEEALALLAGQTESLTPVASHEHEGFLDFYELRGFQEQHADPQELQEQKELAALVISKAYLVSSYALGPSSDQIDFLLDEFAGELILLKSIPPGIDETDCDPEEEIRLIEILLCDNLSPRPWEEFISEISDAAIKFFSPSPIPVEDSDSVME